MKQVKVLGTGCPKCRQLAALTEAAAQAAGVPCQIEKVTDIAAILQHGVMITPALVIDGEVKVAGRLPTPAELQQWLA